jgi:hypothetical protein
VIQRAVRIGMRSLQQLDDLFSASFALGFGFSHSQWSADILSASARSALDL